MATALDYIHAIAEESGEYGRFVTTSAGTTSTLVTSTLANSTLAATEFAGMRVLIETGADAGQVGSILGGGLARATGTLTIGDPFTSATALGNYFSVYRLLGPYREGVRPGILEIANQALRWLWIERTVAISGVTGQYYYTVDTTAYPWWTDLHRVIEIQQPTTATTDIPVSLPNDQWDWDQSGETRRLLFRDAPFNTGQTFGVKVYAPSNSRLKLNATARATVVGGVVTAVTVVLPGYYSATPTVTISGGGGSGATATATLSSGGVASVAVGAGGSLYATTPTVSFTRGASDTGWADQTSQLAGLQGITDEAVSDITDVKTVGLWLFYKALASMQAPGAEVAEWLTKAQQWGIEANRLEHVGEPSNRRTNVANIRTAPVGGYVSRAYGRRAY